MTSWGSIFYNDQRRRWLKKKIGQSFRKFLDEFLISMIKKKKTDDAICWNFCNFWNASSIGYLVNPLQESWECPSSWSYSRGSYVLTISIHEVSRKHIFKHTNELPFIIIIDIFHAMSHDKFKIMECICWNSNSCIHVERSLSRYVRKVDLSWYESFFDKGSK